MHYQIPPLNGLRAFEAAGRHMSFKEAARELFVTPGAVSQQIKVLEGHLGTSLFRRGNRTIEMTAAGRALLPVLREAFQNISDAIERLSGQGAARPLTASVLPSFAIKWLVPRLGRFRERHPEFDVRISTATQLVDFAREEIDLEIRNGDGRWPGLDAVLLMEEEVFPVCSPVLVAGAHPLRQPADLAHHELLHVNGYFEDWTMWFRAAGIGGLDARRGDLFDQSIMAIQAAISGLGVALGRTPLVANELGTGRLVAPFDIVLPGEDSYWITYPRSTPEHAGLVAFRDWLLEEVAGAEEEGQRVETPAA